MTVERWRYVVLACDLCPEEIAGDDQRVGAEPIGLVKVADVRAEATAQGWRRESGKDICWKHKTEAP